MVTVAPATTAPLESVTLPVSVPYSTCALAVCGVISATSSAPMKVWNAAEAKVVNLMTTPLGMGKAKTGSARTRRDEADWNRGFQVAIRGSDLVQACGELLYKAIK